MTETTACLTETTDTAYAGGMSNSDKIVRGVGAAGAGMFWLGLLVVFGIIFGVFVYAVVS